MPLGSIIHLLTTTNTNMVASIANIHSSVRNLDDDYMQSDHNKDVLLKPENSGLLITQGEINPPEPKIDKFYKCSSDLAEEYCCTYTDSKGTLCSECGDVMNTELKYVDPNVGGSQKMGVKKVEGDGGGPGGYVKGLVTYMVMDDLTVAPLSTISGLTLLNKLSIKDTGLLEERRVSMGMEQSLALLKASFESETVLTDVFLGQKK